MTATSRTDAMRGLTENAYGAVLSPEQKLLKAEGDFNTNVARFYLEKRAQSGTSCLLQVSSKASTCFAPVMKIAPEESLWKDGKISLSNIPLPTSLRNKLPNSPATVLQWVKSITNRVEWPEDLIVTPHAVAVPFAIDTHNKSTEFTLSAQHGSNECWLYATFTQSGDHGEWVMELKGSAGYYKLQLGKEGEQHNFTFFPIDAQQMAHFQNEAPALAHEISKSSAITVGIKLEKVDVERGISDELLALLQAQQRDRFDFGSGGGMKGGGLMGGIIGQGELDALRYRESSYKGKFRVAKEDHFAAVVVGVGVDATGIKTESELKTFFTALDGQVETAQKIAESQFNVRSKQATLEGMFAKLRLQTDRPCDFFMEGGCSYLDFSQIASVDSEGFLLLGSSKVKDPDDLYEDTYVKLSPTSDMPKVVMLQGDSLQAHIFTYLPEDQKYSQITAGLTRGGWVVTAKKMVTLEQLHGWCNK